METFNKSSQSLTKENYEYGQTTDKIVKYTFVYS